MIRWMVAPRVITWTTDQEYRLVDGLVTLASSGSREELERASAIFKSDPRGIGAIRHDIERLLIELHRMHPSSDGYYAQEALIDLAREVAGGLALPDNMPPDSE